MRSKKSVRPKNYSIDKIFQFAINLIENPMEIFGGLAPRLGFCFCLLSVSVSNIIEFVWAKSVGLTFAGGFLGLAGGEFVGTDYGCFTI